MTTETMNGHDTKTTPTVARVDLLPILMIKPSPLNPAGRCRGPEFEELVASVREHGVLVPILVRPVKSGYEAVAGHRRLSAARGAGLEVIPAVARELTDEQSLELQLVENLQRSDIHPLDEAEGYLRLRQAKYDVARIAEKIGRTPVYVYDRLKLVDLIPELKQSFRVGDITAGLAVILARLKPADQKRALKDALFVAETGLLFETDDRREGTTKAVSARELQAWVNKHVRATLGVVDPVLFPDSDLELTGLGGAKLKVVPITTENYIPDEARAKERTYFPASWKRADGKKGSKPCEYAVVGHVVIGARKDDVFPVCVDKQHCEVHWGSEIRERRAAAKRRESGTARVGDRERAPASKEESPEKKREREAREAARLAASEEILEALMKASAKLSLEMSLRTFLPFFCDPYVLRDFFRKIGKKNAPESDKAQLRWSSTADRQELQQYLAYMADEFGNDAALAVGIDVKAIYSAHEKRALEALKPAASTKPTPTTKPAKSKSAKKRTR